jgi:hypothetical protein
VSGKLPKPIRDADEIMKWETKAEKAAGEIDLPFGRERMIRGCTSGGKRMILLRCGSC